MKEGKERLNWCNNPDIENFRNLKELFTAGDRIDAWREFFQSETLAAIKAMKGAVISFNKHDYFNQLICMVDCNEDTAIETISTLMRPGYEKPVEFLRDDIFDARAWTFLPLSCFTETKDFTECCVRDIWQKDMLGLNPMPVLRFGIKKPWVVSRELFTFSHKIKKGERYAQITFAHPQLDARFDNNRMCAHGTFPKTATRQEMEDVLWPQVEKKCAENMVIITQPEK